jgi:hypothetical protein
MKTYDEWARYYRPHRNHLTEHASFDGVMFETYGAELEYVRGFDYNRVWTYISDVDGDRIEHGMRAVDRLGYFITDEPWVDGEEWEWCDLSLDNEADA